MTDTTAPKRQRRMAREPQASPEKGTSPATVKSPSKLDRMEVLLRRANGATIADMVKATGWQKHSVRGAMAGALKKRGFTTTSEKVDGVRRYRAERAA